MTVHVLDADILSGFYCLDHLADGFLGPLNFHGDAAVPFIPYPAGTAVQLCGMVGTIAEADALDPAIEGDVLANSIHRLPNPASLRPGQQNIRKPQFIDILKVIYNSVLLQLLQEGVHEYGVGKRL